MAKKPALLPLGGWGDIVPTAAGRDLENGRRLPLTLIDINPDQARQSFDETGLDELTTSVRAYGVLQPIGVRAVGARYRIIFGERRYRAATAAGLTEIPVVIYDDLDDEQAAVLTALENLQREDLDLEEEARQFAKLLTITGLSQRGLAEQLGKSHNYISRRLRLLRERPEVFAAIRAGRIGQREALDLMAERDPPTTGASQLYHRDTVPQTTGASQLYHGDTVAPPPESSSPLLINGQAVSLPPSVPTVRTDRAELDAQRSTQILEAFRPVQRFYRFAQALQPANVPVASRPALRQQLEEAITAAQVAIRALDEV